MSDKSYDNFNEAVEQAVDKRLDGFAETLNKQMTDVLTKSYANNWLKSNPLMMGGEDELSKPAAQSYLVYKCVTVIANNFPQAPFVLLDSRDEPLPPTHPLNILFSAPNENMSGFDLWSATSTFYTLYGEAYWYIVKSIGQEVGSSKIPAEIIVLDPRRMTEVVDPNTGSLVGWYYNGDAALNSTDVNRASYIPLDVNEVIQFKNTNPYNRFRGLSPLDAVNIEIKSDYKASVYQTRFFDNDAKPGLILQTDKDDTSSIAELRKLVRLWEQGHKGAENAHKIGVLRGGMTFKTLGLTQQEMDFINSRVFTRDIVLSTFGVPKTLAGFTEGINRATADTQKRIFWSETIKPQMLRMQERLNARFIATVDRSIHGKFDFSKIDELKSGFETEVKAGKILLDMGFSANEINQRFGLGFDEVPERDAMYVPMNLIDVNDTLEPEPTKQIVEEIVVKDDKSTRMTRQRQIFLKKQRINERMLLGKLKKYFITQRTKVLKGLFNKADISTSELIARINIFEKEDERLVTSITPLYQLIMEDAGEMALSFINSSAEYEIDKGILFNRINKVKGINKTIFNQLKMEIATGVEAGETINDISTRIKKIYKFADKRATTIARTESSSLMSETSLQAYQTNGVGKKLWLTAGDGEVRPEHAANANQGAININRPFQNGEMFPGQNSINCRCSVSPYIDN